MLEEIEERRQRAQKKMAQIRMMHEEKKARALIEQAQKDAKGKIERRMQKEEEAKQRTQL